MKLNDITLPDDRGFPFQVVAESKFSYKWSKWITRIELSDNTNFRGYWEGNSYNNNADINGPAFESSPQKTLDIYNLIVCMSKDATIDNGNLLLLQTLCLDHV